MGRKAQFKMKTQELIEALSGDKALSIMLPDGSYVPEHFHITEVGKVDKVFIDCGGTKREHKACVLQVWTAHDVDHRLKSEKLRTILELSKDVIGDIEDLPIEVEYGKDVAATYHLSSVTILETVVYLFLAGKQTDCLAPDKCGVSGCC